MNVLLALPPVGLPAPARYIGRGCGYFRPVIFLIGFTGGRNCLKCIFRFVHELVLLFWFLID